jgi:hypothetical protein
MSEDRRLQERKSVIDEQIRDAISAGKFSNLPGEGKPLKLDDEGTPNEWRMAYKILKDNDLAPDWIMDGKELEASREQMLTALRRAAKSYRQGGLQADAAWGYARRTFVEAAVVYNRKVLSYNLKVPAGVTHRAPLDINREVEQALDAARPNSAP